MYLPAVPAHPSTHLFIHPSNQLLPPFTPRSPPSPPFLLTDTPPPPTCQSS